MRMKFENNPEEIDAISIIYRQKNIKSNG